MFRGITCCILVLLKQFLNDRMRKPSPEWTGFFTWAKSSAIFGEGSERHERPFGKASLYLDKQAYGPHRVNGYVKYMAQPYGQTRAMIPLRKEAQGEPDAAYKQAMAA